MKTNKKLAGISGNVNLRKQIKGDILYLKGCIRNIIKQRNDPYIREIIRHKIKILRETRQNLNATYIYKGTFDSALNPKDRGQKWAY